MADEGKRMQWLDAMRGFTMILVVAYHVAQMSFGQDEKVSASLPFLVLFRMPLFFFVSGFLAYKARWVWTAQSFCSLTWKKMKVQVLPAVVFLSICILLKGRHDFWDGMYVALRSPYKCGYWFTWVLLQMFIIYYVVAALQQRLADRHNILLWTLFAVSIVGYLSIYMPYTFGRWWKTDWMMYTSVIQVFKFMQFFVLGNLVHRYWERVQRLMDSRWFFPVVTVIAMVSCADFFRTNTLTGQWINLSKTAATYSLLLIVIMTFRHYSDRFTKDTVVGRGLQYIGTRTLDVYLLHFILLPKLPMVGEFLDKHHPNFVLDIVLAGSMAIIIIGACLIVSNILRVSPIFKEYLFGRK